MQITQSAQSWLWPGAALPESIETAPAELLPPVPARERDARLEITRLRHEIEQLVRGTGDNPRDTLDSALESVTRLQVVTANIDACGPPSATFAGAALVALADSHLRGHSDAIERGMTYTADNQIRLLRER
ncbi:MAG TPA: hypothetical protein VGP92_06725 [Acidimicrobiia bacterium]|nr:hypothetical protein [Acidimicrobiia bacterium]